MSPSSEPTNVKGGLGDPTRGFYGIRGSQTSIRITEVLLKQTAGPDSKLSDSVDLRWVLRVCISICFPV